MNDNYQKHLNEISRVEQVIRTTKSPFSKERLPKNI